VGEIIQYLVENSKRCQADKISFEFFQINKKAGVARYDNSSSFYIHKFADKLKDFVCILIGCTREQLEDQDFKNKELGEEWNCYIFNNGKKEELTLNYNIAKTLSADNRIISRILTPRLLLQLLGTECIRDKVHPNAWVNALFADYKAISVIRDSERNKVFNEQGMHQFNYPNWIITDVRFPNELEAIKSRKGISIRINRYPINLEIDGKKLYVNQEDFDNQIIKQAQHPSETALDNSVFDYTIENNGSIEDLIHTVSLILKREKII